MKKILFVALATVMFTSCSDSLSDIYNEVAKKEWNEITKDENLCNYQWEYAQSFYELAPYYIEQEIFGKTSDRYDYWSKRLKRKEEIFLLLKGETATQEDYACIAKLKKIYAFKSAAQVAARHDAKMEQKEEFDRTIEKILATYPTP